MERADQLQPYRSFFATADQRKGFFVALGGAGSGVGHGAVLSGQIAKRTRQKNPPGGFPLLTIILALLAPFPARALTELSAQFGHHKQAYGINRQNSIVTKTYHGNISIYILRSTALDLSYGEEVQRDSVRDLGVDIVGSSERIVGSEQWIKASSYGLGLKQALAPRRALLRPTFSMGYARRKIRSSSAIVSENGGSRSTYRTYRPSKIYDSVFASLALQVRIGRRLSLQASVRSVFKAFEYERASDNVRYLFGLSWIL